VHSSQEWEKAIRGICAMNAEGDATKGVEHQSPDSEHRRDDYFCYFFLIELTLTQVLSI
jgi:hypothetical protein